MPRHGWDELPDRLDEDQVLETFKRMGFSPESFDKFAHWYAGHTERLAIPGLITYLVRDWLVRGGHYCPKEFATFYLNWKSHPTARDSWDLLPEWLDRDRTISTLTSLSSGGSTGELFEKWYLAEQKLLPHVPTNFRSALVKQWLEVHVAFARPANFAHLYLRLQEFHQSMGLKDSWQTLPEWLDVALVNTVLKILLDETVANDQLEEWVRENKVPRRWRGKVLPRYRAREVKEWLELTQLVSPPSFALWYLKVQSLHQPVSDDNEYTYPALMKFVEKIGKILTAPCSKGWKITKVNEALEKLGDSPIVKAMTLQEIVDKFDT
jgi:hypothetical protein